MLTDGINLQTKKIILREAMVKNGEKTSEQVAIGYGKLLEVGVDFVIIGFTVFIIVKFMNSLRKQAQDPNDKKVITPKDIEFLNNLNVLMEKQNQLLEEGFSKT
jgi:large conductance mechanosensitive channel